MRSSKFSTLYCITLNLKNIDTIVIICEKSSASMTGAYSGGRFITFKLRYRFSSIRCSRSTEAHRVHLCDCDREHQKK